LPFPGSQRETEEEIDFGNFKIFDDPTNVYASTNFMYEDIQFQRMSQLMEYNTKNCLDIIKEELAYEVNRKKKKIAERMNMEVVTMMALKNFDNNSVGKKFFSSGGGNDNINENGKVNVGLRLSIAQDRKLRLLESQSSLGSEDSSEYSDALEYLNGDCGSTNL